MNETKIEAPDEISSLFVLQIRRYKASSAVMEKATEIYNKLKLQFVGKLEANKPKPEEKEKERDDKTETQVERPVSTTFILLAH